MPKPKPIRPRITPRDVLAGKFPPGSPPRLRAIDFSEMKTIGDADDAEVVYPISLKVQAAPVFAFYGFALPKTFIECQAVSDYVSLLHLQLFALSMTRPQHQASYLASLEEHFPGMPRVLERLLVGDSKGAARFHKADRRVELCINKVRLCWQLNGKRNPGEVQQEQGPTATVTLLRRP